MWRVVGVLTFFEEEMLRIAQLLREMLSRRPSREELQRRGIYKGTNFTQLKLNEMRQWNVVLLIVIIINEFHRDASLKQNFRAAIDVPLLYRGWQQVQHLALKAFWSQNEVIHRTYKTNLGNVYIHCEP